MKILLLSVTVISSLLMVGIILLQQGKGAGLGSAFGGGARGGLYESSGQANPLSRVTAILATVFLASSLALSLYIGQDSGVLDELLQTPAESTESIIPSSNADNITDAELEGSDSINDSDSIKSSININAQEKESDKSSEIPE